MEKSCCQDGTAAGDGTEPGQPAWIRHEVVQYHVTLCGRLESCGELAKGMLLLRVCWVSVSKWWIIVDIVHMCIVPISFLFLFSFSVLLNSSYLNQWVLFYFQFSPWSIWEWVRKWLLCAQLPAGLNHSFQHPAWGSKGWHNSTSDQLVCGCSHLTQGCECKERASTDRMVSAAYSHPKNQGPASHHLQVKAG